MRLKIEVLRVERHLITHHPIVTLVCTPPIGGIQPRTHLSVGDALNIDLPDQARVESLESQLKEACERLTQCADTLGAGFLVTMLNHKKLLADTRYFVKKVRATNPNIAWEKQ
jgi:hypothetical protein